MTRLRRVRHICLPPECPPALRRNDGQKPPYLIHVCTGPHICVGQSHGGTATYGTIAVQSFVVGVAYMRPAVFTDYRSPSVKRNSSLLVRKKFLLYQLRSSPHCISLRTKRSASATFPPSSVGNDPQGGSDSNLASRIQPPREEWFSLVIPAYAGDNREVGQNR